jgi:hypothetical protein
MKSDIEIYIAPAMAALVHLPFEFAHDFAKAPNSSKEHFARAIGNIATAAGKAEKSLTEKHPNRAQLIRAAISDILANSVLDERAFTLSAESLDVPSGPAEVKANLIKLEEILKAQCEIVLRACELVEAKQNQKAVEGAAA